jgi:hypothetical protein
LCAYNVYRAFNEQNEKYPYFQRILPYIYKSPSTDIDKIDGLKIFPGNHRWINFLGRIAKERARLLNERLALKK